MSDKRIDMSVLPDGFLIESFHDFMPSGYEWHLAINPILNTKIGVRPLLNNWHFIDLDIVDFQIPEGLVCLCRPHEDEDVICVSQEFFLESKNHSFDYREISAFRVLGVHKDYAEHGKELGMQVVEL